MPKRKQEGKSLTELFTMTDERTQSVGEFYFLETDSLPRKEISMTRTNARTPQFSIVYNGKEKTLTIPITSRNDNDWKFELARFVEMKLSPPTQMDIEGSQYDI